ncbi:uncharacterized protein PV09_06894 [Verruconis gallopava]|uniref:Major facilitator superfamily (MFS) profile domain-containing protein n=1 Tax=Verruconis gallopava TaxID=253628 RepID=A0A0D1YLK4_9PEZI|nr:uncharacterized protein PV09_06894 [Verruconis gallopava]KIW01717.1 hypothetical protein PV09_06894 [Verruconis gallopava]
MAAIFRDSSAGQICRLFLGMKIAPYEDEKEGFSLPQAERPQAAFPAVPSVNGSSDEADDPSEAEAEKNVEEDVEGNATGAFDANVPTQTRAARDPNIITWTGPNDEDNPQNWSTLKKCFTFGEICLLTFTIYSASAIVTPAEPTFEEKFGLSGQVSALSLSMYVIGYGIGPLVFSPMSEMGDVGRNIAYMGSFVVFIIMTAVGSGVNNYPGIVVVRFIQGFFGGPVLAMGAASAQDILPFHKVQYGVSFWTLFAYAGPAIGPLLTGFAVPLDTWRWSFYETLILAGFTLFLLFFFLPETSAEYILTKRAARLRIKTGNQDLKSEFEAHARQKDWLKLISYHLIMPFKITALDPSILFINSYTALVYGIYYSFFESFPLVYIRMYGFSIGVMGIVFLSIIIGAGIALIIYAVIIRVVYEPYNLQRGIGKPEYRLVPGIPTAALTPVGMFIFGYAAKPSITWVGPTVGLSLYAATTFILINSLFIYLPLSYPRYVASIFAANGFFRSAMACAAIHFSQPLFNNLGVGNGCAVLGGLAAGCAIVFVGLWKWGPYLRARSKFAEAY